MAERESAKLLFACVRCLSIKSNESVSLTECLSSIVRVRPVAFMGNRHIIVGKEVGKGIFHHAAQAAQCADPDHG